ncbi:hypothetical protein [Novosphingobium sp. Gsoil 351]|uniref:hypothetical protein n=1 Tax=Novosphingobium sp. Gsoil 351 TaxID=2675225 RepID=UPI0018A7F585|nr:hypothetical protein [Novosphingobium sp. Gsoil 351]
MRIVAWPCAAPGGSGEEFALVTGPTDAAARILIVPALFEEFNRTRRMLVETMRTLAGARIASVLLDLPGCNESLAALDAQNIGTWRDATAAAAAHFGATHALSLRGGALVAPGTLPGWRFEPIDGPQVLRPMLRARTVSAREEGLAETMEGLLEGGREAGIELAGYRLGAAMIGDLEIALLSPSWPHVILTLDDLGGSALWLRSEPGEDADLSAALAARIVADLAR